MFSSKILSNKHIDLEEICSELFMFSEMLDSLKFVMFLDVFESVTFS